MNIGEARGQSLGKNMKKSAGVWICVFTHTDSLKDRHWDHNVPFYSGHTVVPPH